MGEIIITLDIDWANDEILFDVLTLLNKFNIKTTLFMTHSTCVNVQGHELAIHPFFTSFDFDKHIGERMAIFPYAKGTRSHSLFDSYQLQPVYSKYRLKYQSNYFMYKQNNIQPFLISNNFIEIPIYFMDNLYIMIESSMSKPSFSLSDFNLDAPGLKIFDFHPIHIFLNTDILDRYEKAKIYYHDVDQLCKFKNEKERGIRKLFIGLLEYIKANRIKTRTLIEIVLN